MQSSAARSISMFPPTVSAFLELFNLIHHSMASLNIVTALQRLFVLSRSLARQLARATKESKEWEDQCYDLSDAILRNSDIEADIEADMAKTLQETRARHVAELAAAEERAVMREEVRTTLPAVAAVMKVTCRTRQCSLFRARIGFVSSCSGNSRA